ncbi:MAG: hypothetical protein RL264_29 [Bacteroidota bacterium]|jgi:hypothetical protein
MKSKKLILGAVILGLTIIVFFMFQKKDQSKVENNHENTKRKVEFISTDFNENQFESEEEVNLLKEISICDTVVTTDNNLDQPACSPKFFRFFKLRNTQALSDGFMLQVRAGVNKFPTRRLLIFERENGKLVKVNGFVGYIIERRPSQGNYDDIVVRFFERYYEQKYFYNCLFTWKNGMYQFKSCEAINEMKIKSDKADSVSTEVLKILNEKQLLF